MNKSIKKYNNKLLRELFQYFRKVLPFKKKVVLILSRKKACLLNDYGITIPPEDKEPIKIIIYNSFQCERIDTLIHEYAHAMRMARNDYNEHGNSWGIAYAKTYRKFLEFFDK